MYNAPGPSHVGLANGWSGSQITHNYTSLTRYIHLRLNVPDYSWSPI